MRKNVFGRQLKRDKNERQALFKNLMSSLVLEGKIKTTEPKAKAIKGEVDKLVTKARKEGRLAKKLLEKHLSPKAVEKMISSVAPRFNDRNGGYTRMIRLGKRFGDDASVVLMEWVEKPIQNLESKIKTKEEKTTKKEIKTKEEKPKKEKKK